MQSLNNMVEKARQEIQKAKDVATIEKFRVKYLGKKGHLTLQMKSIGALPIEKRPEAGKLIQKAKIQLEEVIRIKKNLIEKEVLISRLESEAIDVSLPGRYLDNGGLHPISCTIHRINNFFTSIGFEIIDGIEIEDSYHNFDALNIPVGHPARNENDTFWFDTNRLLRTQTSSVQIRMMKENHPPIRMITSGRVYRRDCSDRTHTPMFHQMEGLFIDKTVSFANLRNIVNQFLQYFFEKKPTTRFRPSYFPFTQLSAEVDILNRNKKWLEVLGCGMVHKNVLHNVGIDSEIYSGFAFGIGIERLTMIRHSIGDLRSFLENDLRFLKQFK